MDYEKLTKKLTKIKPYLTDKYLYHTRLVEDLDVKYTYHSNAIEGSTLTLQETALILEGISIGKKPMRELYEATNHSKAFQYIMNFRKRIDKTIGETEIKHIHSIILSNINDYYAGVYREIDVGIRGTDVIFPAPYEVTQLMIKFSNNITEKQKIGIEHPVKLASEAHFEFINIHPFVDGNGRTARLLMNAILLRDDYPTLVIKLEDRDNYINAIRTGKENFNTYIYNTMDNNLDQYIKKVKNIEQVKFSKRKSYDFL